MWTAFALAAVFWGFKLLVRPAPVPAHALPVAMDQSVRGDPLRLFAAPPVVAAAEAAPLPQVSSRFKLVGVMAPKPDADGDVAPQGVALIAVDGKPAKAYPVGAPVEGEWVLQSVSARSASIGPEGGTAVALIEVPPLPPAATGTLPAPATEGGSVAPPQQPYRPPAAERPAPPGFNNRPAGVRAPGRRGGKAAATN